MQLHAFLGVIGVDVYLPYSRKGLRGYTTKNGSYGKAFRCNRGRAAGRCRHVVRFFVADVSDGLPLQWAVSAMNACVAPGTRPPATGNKKGRPQKERGGP